MRRRRVSQVVRVVGVGVVEDSGDVVMNFSYDDAWFVRGSMYCEHHTW
jgi:hypothetical protein